MAVRRVTERRAAGADHRATSSALPPTGPVLGHGRLVADQAEQQRLAGGAAGRVERLVERDRALGERAGLVGEQHLDVAEVLDGHEPLDQHPLAGELRASRSRG